ncbi:MAG: hypothetical protein ACM3KE_03185 [Hyphomicrobiales bacterium]
MEKRAHRRHRINTSIVCSYLDAVRSRETLDGRMKNCCSNGLCAELRARIKTGTVLVIRTTGNSCGYSREEGFCSLALAEVRWSKPMSVAGDVSYATGLKYMLL